MENLNEDELLYQIADLKKKFNRFRALTLMISLILLATYSIYNMTIIMVINTVLVAFMIIFFGIPTMIKISKLKKILNLK